MFNYMYMEWLYSICLNGKKYGIAFLLAPKALLFLLERNRGQVMNSKKAVCGQLCISYKNRKFSLIRKWEGYAFKGLPTQEEGALRMC